MRLRTVGGMGCYNQDFCTWPELNKKKDSHALFNMYQRTSPSSEGCATPGYTKGTVETKLLHCLTWKCMTHEIHEMLRQVITCISPVESFSLADAAP